MKRNLLLMIVLLGCGAGLGWLAAGQSASMKKWQKGQGWGWVWGPEDEVGALNEMTDA